MERTEIFYTDLGKLCTPSCNISEQKEIYKWNSVPYETASRRGTMLVSQNYGRPQPVTLSLNVEGWYRIYAGLGCYTGALELQDYIELRLSGDEAVSHLGTSRDPENSYQKVEEVYWKSADLTGQSLIISKARGGQEDDAILAWIRLVPMSEEEVAAFRKEQSRTDTKRIYATNDMHGMFCQYGYQEKEDWKSVVQEYVESDVEWFSMENVSIFDGFVSTGNLENFVYLNSADRTVQYDLKRYFTPEMLAYVTEYGHRLGIKMCVSVRMGAWGIEFPDDQKYFVNSFAEAHPEYRTIDRDGLPIDAMSYIYPEVQDYMLDQFRMMAGTGCDAVEMIFSRGVPYVLFEEPFVRLFEQRYGEDPRYLPLDDDRVTALRCEVMTGFVKRLRRMLDEISPDRHIRIHARCQFSVWDARHVGEDLETWAKEGLIDAVISYPQRIREVLDGDVWQEGNPDRLDLDKFTRYANSRPETMIYRKQDFNFMPPMPDSHGVLRGPASQEERVAEFMELEKKYGVTVYLEIMPRTMSTEQYRDRALELYRAGCGHISYWDTYSRVPRKVEWSMIRRSGHREELAGFDSGKGSFYRYERILHVGGMDISRYKPAWGG